jgi:hypothetical protein
MDEMHGSGSVGQVVGLNTLGMTTTFISGSLDQLFASGPGLSWAYSRATPAAGSTITWAIQLAWVDKPVPESVVGPGTVCGCVRRDATKFTL